MSHFVTLGVYIGGTSWIAALAPAPVLDPEQRLFNWIDLDPDRFVAAGTVQSAGSAYAWACDCLGGVEALAAESGSRYPALDDLAARAKPGSNGLFFLPYLMGERSPIWDPLARGVFFGLSLAHGRPEMLRAVLEGVSYALRSVLDAIEDARGPVDSIRLIGGGPRSSLWRAILGAVYRRPILLPEYLGEATSLGAAIAAGVGAGVYVSIADGASRIRAARQPDAPSDLIIRYDRGYRFYQSLYPRLKDAFREHALLQAESASL